MKLKYFIIALVAMLSCFTSKALAQEVIIVHNAQELKQALMMSSSAESSAARRMAAATVGSYPGTKLELNGYYDATHIEGMFQFFNPLVLDLNGCFVNGNLTLSSGQLSIIDSKGTGAYIGTITTKPGAVLAIGSGNIISNDGAAIVNGGVLTIDGGAVIGKITDNGGTITENADYNMALLADVATMQKALNVAIDGQGVKFAQDIEGNLTVPQSPDTKITVDGDNKTMKGYIVVDGKSSAYPTTGTTIKNVHFDASAISLGASVNLGDGGNSTRYTNNVTVDNCTFTSNIAKAAVKSYQGGCKNLVVSNCKAEGMHSLLQAVNIQGITITGCEANTKNGINLNSSSNVTVENNTINVQGYAVRVGVNGGESGKIELEGNKLTSQCADGDAVVVLRGTAPAKVDLTMEKNAVSGTIHISGNDANTKMELDANYWDGKENPVVTGPEVKVNSYYETTDFSAAPTRNPMGGAIVGYTSSDAIWGETWSNASASYVVKVIDANGNVMGTTSLNNVGGIMNGKNVAPTWNIKFDAASNTDEYWTMSWTNAPTIANMPAKVQLWVDGEKVSEGDVKLSAADDLHKIVAATTDADGRILSCQTSLENAVKAGDNVAILVPGTYSVPAGKNLTVTGAVDGVKFENIGACNMGGANVTFNNVTFDYYPNVNYTGLQHSGNLVYNNCTFNGQVFLYGASETFNKCTFNQNSSDAYNVWTYSAKEVAFNECIFKSAGKSVLIYHEAASVTNNVSVAKSQFIASQQVAGKAAIEMDSERQGAINLTIDASTTATGFATGSVSGNSLWNNKKGNGDNANNDITVKVGEETVLAPEYDAEIGETGHRTFQEAINAVKNGETITLVRDIDGNVTLTEKVGLYYTIDGAGKTMNGSMTITPLSDGNDNRRITIKNINFVNTADAAVDFISCAVTNHYPRLTVEGCTFTGNGNDTDVALRLKTAYGAVIKDCTGTGLHSFLQNTAGLNMTIENVKVTDSKSAFALGTVQGVTVKGCEADVEGYGIRLDAQYNNNAVIDNNSVKAFIPVVVRKAGVNSNIAFNGANTMEAKNTDGIWCAVGTSEYETNGQMPTAATGKVKVNLNDTGLDSKGVYGNFGVASIGTVNYNTLAEALTAAVDGDVVTLNWSEGDAPIAMNGAVFGKNVTIKGTAKVDWSKGFLFVGRGGEGNATVTFDGANLTSASNSASTGIHVSGREKNTTNKYDGTLVIKNSSIELDYLINKGAMTLDKAALTVKNGCAIGGRPATETENGQDATATISLTNESKLVVNNHNGMGLGYEAIGVMNIDATSTFETTQSFLVTAKGTMNIAGKATVAGTLTNQGAIKMIDKAATLTSSECGNVTTNVADHKVVYANGTYKVVAKKYVAIIDENRKFETFKEALDAILGGETITLVADEYTEGKESGEIEFDRAIAFTITGKSTKYALPVVTFQNAKVTIKDAEILIPELDARQNAVIDIVNSTVHDAGGNSIAKSYYNGTINIDKTSTVHMMQVTTMGYINVAGTLNATWQTNVYGNGIITLAEGAKFNTAALHLTGQDYSSRDNTDATRVGKPATIVVDGAILNVGKVKANNGSDYSYNSSKGINVGTVDGKQALLDVKNGGAVNFYMANGQTTNFGAGATVNVASSTLKTICRDENGTVTLANNGSVYVTGNSQLDVKKYSGNAIKIENANLADSYFAGRVDAFGVNNLTGTTVIGGILGLGYGTNPTEQVVVNITGKFTGTNVLVSTNNGVDNLLNVGKADGSRTTAHFAQLGAFADVNVANADVTYGYAFIRNDFNAINSTFAIKGGVNTYFSGNAKVVLDNTTWNLSGYANIGSYGGYMYGNADVTLKNGSSMTATNLGIEVSGEKVVKLTLEDNSKFTATKLSNQGSIVLASTAASITANEVPNVTTSVADHKVVYADGIYKAVAKIYVATIDENRKYESFKEALANVVNGDIITLVADCGEDVTIQQKVGVSFTVDGAGKTYNGTITVKGDGTTNGSNTETLTFKNINFVVKANAYAITAVKGSHARNITVDGCTFKGTETSYGIRVRNGWNYTVKNTTVDGFRSFFNASENLSGLTVENVTVTNANSAFNAAYGFGKATFRNVNINVAENGIWIKNQNAFNMTLENCSIAAAKPIQVEEYAKFTNSITLNGTNNLVAANDGNWLTIVDAPAVDATFKVLANDLGLDLSKVEGLAAYAKNAQRSYGSNKFQNVTSATLDGDVVTLVADIALDTKTLVTECDGYASFAHVQGKSVTIDLNGKSITANASNADLAGKVKGNMLVGMFSVDGAGKLTFMDSKGGSTVTLNAPDATVYSFLCSYSSGCLIQVDGGTYVVDKVSDSMLYSGGSEGIVVNGGNFTLGNVGTGQNGKPWIFNVNGGNNGHSIVNGGTFNADVNHQFWANEVFVPQTKALRNNGNGTWTVVDAQAYVAEIATSTGSTVRNVGYATLEEAMASMYGNEVTLLVDVDTTEVILIDKSLAINGNGHKVASSATRVFRVTASNIEVTLNGVNMVSRTVMTYPNDIRGISIDPSLTGVQLTLNNSSVDFTDASACDWAYAVNVSGNGTGHTVTVNGGSYEGANVINVHGANNTIVVKDATLTSLYPNNDQYYGACIWVLQNQNSSVEATGNTFNGSNAIAFNLGTGTALTESDNTDNTKMIVAKVDSEYYTSLAEAVAAADGNTVKILHSFDADEPVTVTGNVTLDLNGKTITGTPAEAKAYAVITNKGTLTITGNGTVLCDHTLAGSTSYAVNTITNLGTLNIEDRVTIENKSTAQYQIGYAIDNNSTSTDAVVNIYGGKVTASGSLYYDGIRQFCNSETKENSVVVEGGEVSTIWMQNPSDGANKNTKDVKGSIAISGGKVGVLSLEPSASFEATVTGGHVGEISYFQTAAGRNLVEFVTGGTFGTEINEAFLALGYQLTGDDAPYGVINTGKREAMTFVDGEFTEYVNDRDIEVEYISYTRNITGVWTPLYVPFEVDVEQLAAQGLEVAYINGVRRGDEDYDGILDDPVMEVIYIHGGKADGTNKILKANYPYFVKSANKDVTVTMEIVLKNATLFATSDKTYDCTTMTEKYDIIGNSSVITVKASDNMNLRYTMAASGWSKRTKDSSLKPFRFYMEISSRDGSEPVESAVSSVRIVVRGHENEDGTTTIYDVVGTKQNSDVIYDIHGRRVLDPQKGNLYIVNGKKVVY